MQMPLLIGFAGALGAITRYWIEGVVNRRYAGVFPLGTFVVNISGAFPSASFSP